MKWADLKYFLAYLLPLTVLTGIFYGGFWSLGGVILAFIIIPVIEQILPPDIYNYKEQELENREHSAFFDILIYLNLPMVFGILILLFQRISDGTYTSWETAGLILSTGIMLGSNGINVAHEIGQKRGFCLLGCRILLSRFAVHMHFTTEHNRGHHLWVGTPEDPATSRMNENLFSFWIRSIKGTWLSAWKMSESDLQKAGLSVWSVRNEMLQYSLFQILWLGFITWYFGTTAAMAAFFIALISVLLLESINYIEHYGLMRKKNADGKYERVELHHSWNSDHQMGRIMLYELTRHSDHHYKASKKYQTLKHYDASPQLPYGYPASILIALIPPLWYKVMNPKLAEWQAAHA
ncbi:MAG: alkane 1-monooxygenase [Saprospiraceae bacterium]|nr:alkane 1-monooxygenase [Saprospiraceae bacterium]